MQIYFHSRLCSYLSRVPILVEGTVYIYIYIYIYTHTHIHTYIHTYMYVENVTKLGVTGTHTHINKYK